MSKSAWWRLRHYISLSLVTLAILFLLALLTFVSIDAFLRLVLRIPLEDLQKPDAAVVVAVISFLVPLLVGGLSVYTNYKSQLEYLVSLAQRDMEEGRYEEAAQHYRDYLKLPMHVIWPSERMEFYRWWADVLPKLNRALERENTNEALSLLELRFTAPTEVIRNTLAVVRVETLLAVPVSVFPIDKNCAEYLESVLSPFTKQMSLLQLYKLRKELEEITRKEQNSSEDNCSKVLEDLYEGRIGDIPPLREIPTISLGKDHVVPAEIEVGKMPLIPSLKVLMPKELQSKVLRLHLYRSPAGQKERGELEDWAGSQERHDYHVEIAWVKAGMPRPDRIQRFCLSEESICQALHNVSTMPFRSSEEIVSELFVLPSYPERFLDYLQEDRHQVVFGKAGSGKTWLSQMLGEILSKRGEKVFRYNLALGRSVPLKSTTEAMHGYEREYLIVSEAEELIKMGANPRSVWEALAEFVWNERFFRKEGLFVKLILPKVLEPYLRNSMPVVHSPVEIVELRWSGEDLKKLWLHRINSCIETKEGRDESSILEIVGGGPNPDSFRLKGKWKVPGESERWTQGVDEYLISLASGSPKCLMALGRRFLEHIAYMRYRTEGKSALDPEREVYESLAMLLEAYYGLRAEPIPECQDIARHL